MDSHSDVSVIIPTYNRPQWLSQAIESALAQTLQPLEIIVVNDGGNKDQTRYIIDKYPQVKYVWQENRGPGAARNLGLKLSRGSYIQFLDDDDWLSADALIKKYSLLIKQPELDIIYSDFYLVDESGKITRLFFESFCKPLPTGDLFSKLLHKNFIQLDTVLWKRITIEKAGGFSNTYGHEDWECLLKTAEFAHFGYIDEPLSYYRQHSNSLSNDFSGMYEGKISFQEKIIESRRFLLLPEKEQSFLLSKYAFQQWSYGDPALARHFLNQSKIRDNHNILPILLSGLMSLNRSFSRRLLHLYQSFFSFIRK